MSIFASPTIVDSALTLTLRIRQSLWRGLFCWWRLATRWLCITATKCNFKLPSLLDHEWLTLRWCQYSEWGSDRGAFSLDPMGCRFLGYARQLPKHLPITLLTRSNIIDALWTLIWEWGSDRVAFFCAYKGWLYVRYVNQRPNWLIITLHTWPEIVDAPLTFILRMGQWPCCILFCL